jgi:hypothetical protein
MVRAVGLEPTLYKEQDFKSCASTGFAMPAKDYLLRPNRGVFLNSSSVISFIAERIAVLKISFMFSTIKTSG